MSHLSTVIRTPRLTLRSFHRDDVAAFFALNQDPDVRRFLGGAPLTMEFCEMHIPRCRNSWEAQGFSQCAIVRNTDGALIGRGGINMLPELDSLEVSWVIARGVWGRGFATEAGRAAITYAFEALHAPALCAPIHAENTASKHVAQKLGMSLDALVDVYGDGVLLENYIMRRADWPRLKSQLAAGVSIEPAPSP